ncbi:MAG: ATP-binding protein [Planctomycetota bacterium]
MSATATTMEFHITHYERYRAEGLEAYRSGDRDRARFCLLKSAEHLYELAARSEGPLQEERSRRAAELLEMARSVPQRDAPRRGLGGGTAEADSDREEPTQEFAVVERPRVKFDDIAGLESVKEEIRLKILYPFQHREAAQRFGVCPGGGVLLYGPPGTGKTMMAKAVAGETDCAFFTVKPSDILSKWVGEAEQNLDALFAAARENAPSIIFVDEIDALAPSRSENRSSVMARLVPQLLAELEGFADTGDPILFIGATNEPWSIDPAMLRPGRFDEKILVGLPDLPARRRLLELNLDGRPVGSDVNLDDLAGRLDGYSGADIRSLCRRAADDAFLDSITGGQEATVDQARLSRAVDETRPSVSPSVLTRFEKYQNEGRS